MGTLTGLLEEAVRRRGGKVALVWESTAWTWREVFDRAARWAGAIHAAGARPGDRAAIFLPNRPETIFAHLGAILAGSVRVPINARYTAREVEHAIRLTEPSVVITDEELRGLAGGPAVRTLRDGEIAAPAEPVAAREEDLTLLCFTSGTSGRPKGVPLTHRNLVSNIHALTEVWEWTEHDTLLLCLPLMHLHALANGLNGWLSTGCTLVLLPKFDAAAVWAALARYRPTMFFGVPAMYRMLLDAAPRDMREAAAVRLWVTGSAPLERPLEREWKARTGRPLVNRYGMTETVMITANPARAPREGTVGPPLPGVEVRIGENGEVAVRGPSVMSGYWRGEQDVTGLDADGFFRTGDIGRFDAEGYLVLAGRAKDIIICGGTNIAPAEIEEALAAHPSVRECAVVGMADPTLGEVPWAVVVPRGPVEEAELATWCAERLAPFKRPRGFVFHAQPLPRNAMQKLDRARVRDLVQAARAARQG